MATAKTADAAAICTAGGKKISDDRLTVRKLMRISGKRALPRLGISATISPIPHSAEPWMSGSRASDQGRGQRRSSAPLAAFDDVHPRGSIIALQQSIVNLAHWNLLTILSGRISL